MDFAGLIQPQVAAQMDKESTYADMAAWTIDHFSPDIIVLHDGLYPDLEQGYIANNCQMIQQFLGDTYGYGQSLNIYLCVK